MIDSPSLEMFHNEINSTHHFRVIILCIKIYDIDFKKN